MWPTLGAIGVEVAKLVINSATSGKQPTETNKRASNVSGSTYHSTSSTTSYQPNQQPHNQSFCRSSTNNMTPSTAECKNCCSSSSNSNNSKSSANNTKPQQSKGNRRYHTIQIPDNGGDIEINIKKTSSRSGKMSDGPSKGPQNDQKRFKNNNKQTNMNSKQHFNENKRSHTEKIQTEFNKISIGASKGNNNQKKQQKVSSAGIKRDNLQSSASSSNNRSQSTGHKFLKSELSSNKSTWMYLGRLKLGTTEAEIQSYLTASFPGYFFKVGSLPLYKDGKLPCFKVQVDNEILEEFQELSRWPVGVKIAKYRHNFNS